MNSLSVALRAGYLSVHTAEGASEKQSSLKVRLRNGLTYLLTYSQQNFSQKQPKQTSRPVENESRKTLLMKWLSDVQRNGFVGDKIRMSTDRPQPWPKPANTSVRRTVYSTKVL